MWSKRIAKNEYEIHYNTVKTSQEIVYDFYEL